MYANSIMKIGLFSIYLRIVLVGEGTVSNCDHFCIDDYRVQIGKLRHTVAKNKNIVDGKSIFTVNDIHRLLTMLEIVD